MSAHPTTSTISDACVALSGSRTCRPIEEQDLALDELNDEVGSEVCGSPVAWLASLSTQQHDRDVRRVLRPGSGR